MGRLVNGVWTNDASIPDPPSTPFNGVITRDGSQGFPGVSGRYHLYVCYGCPFAHRVLMLRALKNLQEHITVSVTHPVIGPNGLGFDEFEGSTVDHVNGKQHLHEVYQLANPSYNGKVTVPLLWDKEAGTAVNNESGDLIVMLNSEFECGDQEKDFYPQELREEIDQMNLYVQNNINFAVYRVGHATTQEAYEEHCKALFNALDTVEEILGRKRYLIGSKFTLSDVRLFVSLIRFDWGYYMHYNCNLRSIESYPNLSNYVREIYQMPGIAETVHEKHIKWIYFKSHPDINPYGIIPLGPIVDYGTPHDRDREYSG